MWCAYISKSCLYSSLCAPCMCCAGLPGRLCIPVRPAAIGLPGVGCVSRWWVGGLLDYADLQAVVCSNGGEREQVGTVSECSPSWLPLPWFVCPCVLHWWVHMRWCVAQRLRERRVPDSTGYKVQSAPCPPGWVRRGQRTGCWWLQREGPYVLPVCDDGMYMWFVLDCRSRQRCTKA